MTSDSAQTMAGRNQQEEDNIERQREQLAEQEARVQQLRARKEMRTALLNKVRGALANGECSAGISELEMAAVELLQKLSTTEEAMTGATVASAQQQEVKDAGHHVIVEERRALPAPTKKLSAVRTDESAAEAGDENTVAAPLTMEALMGLEDATNDKRRKRKKRNRRKKAADAVDAPELPFMTATEAAARSATLAAVEAFHFDPSVPMEGSPDNTHTSNDCAPPSWLAVEQDDVAADPVPATAETTQAPVVVVEEEEQYESDFEL